MYLNVILTFILLSMPMDNIDDQDKPITSSRELVEWCQAESHQYFIAHEKTPYNWTASWWDDATTFYVKGSWLVDKDYLTIECYVAKNAKQKYAIMKIIEEH